MKIKGELLRSGDEISFRVYNKAYPEGFKDYRIVANDVSIEIDDQFVTLRDGCPDDNYDGDLDYTDEVLGR